MHYVITLLEKKQLRSQYFMIRDNVEREAINKQPIKL